jgi:hypothetical protein
VGKVELLFDEESTRFTTPDKTDWGDFTPEAEVEKAPF